MLVPERRACGDGKTRRASRGGARTSTHRRALRPCGNQISRDKTSDGARAPAGCIAPVARIVGSRRTRWHRPARPRLNGTVPWPFWTIAQSRYPGSSDGQRAGALISPRPGRRSRLAHDGCSISTASSTPPGALARLLDISVDATNGQGRAALTPARPRGFCSARHAGVSASHDRRPARSRSDAARRGALCQRGNRNRPRRRSHSFAIALRGPAAPPHNFSCLADAAGTKRLPRSGVGTRARGRRYSPPIMPTIFQAPAASLP